MFGVFDQISLLHTHVHIFEIIAGTMLNRGLQIRTNDKIIIKTMTVKSHVHDISSYLPLNLGTYCLKSNINAF